MTARMTSLKLRLDADLTGLLRGAGTVFVIRALGGALLYLSQILAARWLGLEQFGVFSYAWATTYLLAVLASLGLPICSMRFVSLYRARSDGRNLIRFVRWAWLTAAGSGVVLMLIAWLALVAGERLWGSDQRTILALGFLAIPVLSAGLLQIQTARAIGQVVLAYAPEQVARPFLFIVFGAICVALTASPGAGTFLLLTSAAYLITTTGQGTLLFRILRDERSGMRDEPPGPDDRPRAWLRTALPMLAFSGAQVALAESGIILVGILLPPEAAGIYAAAARTAMLLTMVTMAVDTMSVPKASALHAQGRRAEIDRTLRRAVRLAFLLAMAMMLAMVVAGGFILELFGPQFAAAYPALLILAGGHALAAAVAPVPAILNATGHQDVVTGLALATVALNLVLGVILITAFGVIGAAVTGAVTTVLLRTALLGVLRRRLGVLGIVALPSPGAADGRRRSSP